MYLHLGSNTIVNQSDVIAVFDMDTSTVSKRTKAFLEKYEKQGRVITITDDIPKSMILASTIAGPVVYISQISTATLLKRVNLNLFDDVYKNPTVIKGARE